MRKGFALVITLCLVFLVSTATAQDPAKVGPKIYNCIFENERVRVCEIRFKPGDSIPVHSHPDHFLYIQSAGKMRITPVGGAPAEADFKPSQTLWIPAESHSAVNIGTTEVRAVVVELKESANLGPVERAVMQMEREWADALMKGDMATMERIVAPDWVLINPAGVRQTRAEAMAELQSGVLRFQSTIPKDMQVRVFGDTAIVTGHTVDRGSYKGKEFSGEYRFTDVFVKRDGKWQAVSTHVTPVGGM